MYNPSSVGHPSMMPLSFVQYDGPNTLASPCEIFHSEVSTVPNILQLLILCKYLHVVSLLPPLFAGFPSSAGKWTCMSEASPITSSIRTAAVLYVDLLRIPLKYETLVGASTLETRDALL